MVVKWKKESRKQLRNIYNYYFRVSGQKVAHNILDQIYTTISLLPNHPHLGHIEPGMNDITYNYRSIVAHAHYKIVYRIDDPIIYITGIWDCRQNPERMQIEVK